MLACPKIGRDEEAWALDESFWLELTLPNEAGDGAGLLMLPKTEREAFLPTAATPPAAPRMLKSSKEDAQALMLRRVAELLCRASRLILS